MDTETKLCQGKDVFERMNFLYQASHLMASKNRVAASYYGNIMVGCAKKSVLRIESGIKRTICKSCQSPLIPGETARVRLISKPFKGVRWTCLTCLTHKKYPTKRGYKLWTEQRESVVQIFDYTPKSKKNNSRGSNTGKESLDKVCWTNTEKKLNVYTYLNIYFQLMWHVTNVDIRICFIHDLHKICYNITITLQLINRHFLLTGIFVTI